MQGYRLDTKVIKYVHAESGVDCIIQCMLQDKSCRSANFRKTVTCGGNENCELLKAVDSEEPGSLKQDENFDYYILLEPDRVSTVEYVLILKIHAYSTPSPCHDKVLLSATTVQRELQATVIN